MRADHGYCPNVRVSPGPLNEGARAAGFTNSAPTCWTWLCANMPGSKLAACSGTDMRCVELLFCRAAPSSWADAVRAGFGLLAPVPCTASGAGALLPWSMWPAHSMNVTVSDTYSDMGLLWGASGTVQAMQAKPQHHGTGCK